MNGLVCYYNRSRWQWLTDRAALAHSVLRIPKRKLLRLQLQVVNAMPATFGSDFKVAEADAVDLSAFSTNVVFWLKRESVALAGGDFDYAIAGSDIASSWQNIARGRYDIPFVFPGSKPTGMYVGGVTFFDALGNPVEYGGLRVLITQDGWTGTEATPPAGVGGATAGQVEIADAAVDVVVPLVGMTPTGLVTPWQEGSSADEDWAGPVSPSVTYGNDEFTLHVPLPPGAGLAFHLGWQLVRKS